MHDFADGFLFPVTVFSPEQAQGYRAELESLERRLSGIKTGNKNQLNYPHLLFRFANAICRDEKLLDVVESILGPDILVWGSTFFIKEPKTDTYVSWHQDMKYWGLSDTDGQVSAWIALNNVSQANGCMQFLPKTHLGEMVDHKDTFSDDNFLTRGQEADFTLDEEEIVHIELTAGQASFHHGKLLHASPPNHSDDRRIGYAIQFIAPHVQQNVASKDFAMLVRGEDRYGHFELLNPPDDDLSPEALAAHHRVLTVQNEAMYEGTDKPAP
ncbi:MAG: phytanoyl-CoA dioxygenase family protein [Alphaproteobacteria bacterium]|nr:phytanoyl-CoA dioxygenase family protein [Alphaproteobacteria bacterium]